ncbi:MAG: VCBS domain-containing protein [Porticoccaceae bacterium]
MNDEVKQGEAIQAQLAQRETDQAAAAAQATSAAQGANVAKPEEAAASSDGRTQTPVHSPADGGTASNAAEDAAAGAANAESAVPAVPADAEENSEFAELQRAVAAGEDISKELEAPAAGQGGGGGESIGDAVRFARGLDARDPTAGFDPDIAPPPLITPTANSTLVEEPVAPPPDNGVGIGGLTSAADGGDVRVQEPNLADGSSPNAAALTQSGTFTISAPDGLGSLTIGGVEVLNAGGLTGSPVSTPLGNTLVVTGFDPDTGTVTYEYTLLDNESHPQGQGANDLFDNLPVVLTDSDGDTTEDVLAVRIVDDLPDAISDIDEVGTGGSTGGNVFTGTDDDALDRVQTDVPGADRAGAPITGVVAGSHLDSPLTDGAGIGSVVQGVFGDLVLNANGSYVYTANGGLTSNQTEVFTYTLTDADGDTSTATLTIEIAGQAPPPPPPPPPVNVLSDGDESVTTSEDTLVTGNVLANTVNPDGPAAASVTQFTVAGDATVHTAGDTATMAGVGTLVINANGSYTFTPAANYGGTVPVATYTVTDGAATDVSTLSITVDPVNDAPIANSDTNWAKEDVADASGNVLQNLTHAGAPSGAFADVADTDIDLNALTVTAFTGSIGHGTLTLNSDGRYTYALDNTNPAVQALDEGQTLTDSYTYTVSDGTVTTTATLTVTIFGTDDTASVVTAEASGPDGTVYESGLNPDGSNAAADTETTTGTFTVSATDGIANVVIGGTSYTLADVQAFATTNGVVNTGQGVLTLTGYVGDSQGGTISYSYTLSATIDNDSIVPIGDDAVTVDHFDDSVALTVNGTGGTTASDDLVIRAVDDIPSASDEASQNVAEGATVTGLLDFVPGADGATVTHINDTALVFGGDGYSQSIDIGDGSIKVKADGSYSFTADNPTVSPVAPIGATYTVTDGDGDTAIAQIAFQVTDANQPTGGTSTAKVDDDGLAGDNPLSTSGDIDANVDETIASANEAIYNGTLAFTPGGDTPVSIGFAAMASTAHGGTNAGTGTGTVGTETVTYFWNETTHTLTATGPRGDLFNVVVNDPATGAYTLTLLDNVLHAAGGDETSAPLVGLTYTITDNDDSTATGTLNVTFNDDAASARDFNGIIVDTAGGLPLSSLIDYNLGADGFGGVSLRFDSATSTSGAVTDLKSHGDVVSTAVIDSNGDHLQEIVGFVNSVGGAGYDVGDHIVFTLAPTDPGLTAGGYALTLSDVLDLPRTSTDVSFTGIDAGGPVAQIVVGTSLIISGISADVNANQDYIGVANNAMNVGETAEYSFGTVTGSGTGATIASGDEKFVNDLRFNIFQTGGTHNDQIFYTVTNTVTHETASDWLTIPSGSGQVGLTGPIHAAFDYNQIQFTVTQPLGYDDQFKIGGISYTEIGAASDINMAFSYTASDGDADAVSGSFAVTVTDHTTTTLASTFDTAHIYGMLTTDVHPVT